MPQTFSPPVALPSPKVVLADRPGALQTEILLGCRLDSSAVGDRAGRELLAESLRGELFARVREESGAAYDIAVSEGVWNGGVALLFVQTDVQSNRAVGALTTILERIRATRERRLPAASLENARWNLARRSYTRDASAMEMLLTLVTTARAGQPLRSLGTWGTDLARASSEDLAELVDPCAGHEIAAMIGPSGRLRPEILSGGYVLDEVTVASNTADRRTSRLPPATAPDATPEPPAQIDPLPLRSWFRRDSN